MRAARLTRLPGLSFAPGGLVDLDLPAIMSGAEVVFHLAGRAGVRASFTAERRHHHDNVVVTDCVVSAAVAERYPRSGAGAATGAGDTREAASRIPA